MIRGIELTAIGRTQNFELRYEGGQYFGPRGEAVDNLLDMSCYVYGNAYYTIEDDPIIFCPHCGNFERTKFENYEALCIWSRDQNWSFARGLPENYFAVFDGEVWGIRPAQNKDDLLRTRRYQQVLDLMSDSL